MPTAGAAQTITASKRPIGSAADHGEPPQGIHRFAGLVARWNKECRVATAANHCFEHQGESVGRDRHMGTATCLTLGRQCYVSVLPPWWQSWTYHDGGQTVGRAVATKAKDRCAVSTGGPSIRYKYVASPRRLMRTRIPTRQSSKLQSSAKYK